MSYITNYENTPLRTLIQEACEWRYHEKGTFVENASKLNDREKDEILAAMFAQMTDYNRNEVIGEAFYGERGENKIVEAIIKAAKEPDYITQNQNLLLLGKLALKLTFDYLESSISEKLSEEANNIFYGYNPQIADSNHEERIREMTRPL